MTYPTHLAGLIYSGRERDRGFTEVRYMGLSARGRPVFRRRDVEIMTNESSVKNR